MPRRPARLAAALVATAALAVAAGCGGDDDPGSALGGQKSSTPSRSASGSPSSGSTKLSAANVLTLVATAQVRQRTYSYTTTAGSGDAKTVTSGQAVVGKRTPRFVATYKAGGKTYDVISHGGKVYARGGALGRSRWVEAALGAKSGAARGISGLGVTDPTRTLLVLGKATKYADLGTVLVDGEKTRHLKVTIEKKTYIASHDVPASEQGRVPDQVVVDLFLGEGYLPARTTITVVAKDRTAVSTTTFRDYGEKVSVKAPSAGDVVPAPTSAA